MNQCYWQHFKFGYVDIFQSKLLQRSSVWTLPGLAGVTVLKKKLCFTEPVFQDLHTFETFFFWKGLDLGVRKMLFLSGRRAEKKTKMMPLPIQSSQCGRAYRLLRRTIPPPHTNQCFKSKTTDRFNNIMIIPSSWQTTQSLSFEFLYLKTIKQGTRVTCIISQTFSLKVWSLAGKRKWDDKWELAEEEIGGRETAERVGEREVKEWGEGVLGGRVQWFSRRLSV